MTIEELQEKAKKELWIDKTKLVDEAAKAPYLTQFYIDLLLDENKRVIKLQKELAIKISSKMLHYKCKHTLIPETNKELDMLLNGDYEIANLKETIELQTEIIKYLKEVIISFRERVWCIKNIIDHQKFLEGHG